MAGAAADEGSRWSALPVRMVASPGLRCHEQCSWEEIEGEEEEEWSEAVDSFLGNCTQSRDKGTHLCLHSSPLSCLPPPRFSSNVPQVISFRSSRWQGFFFLRQGLLVLRRP